jgi:hypothetical protein
MTTQFDRFAEGVDRMFDRLDFEQTVEIFQPVTSYEAGSGFTSSVPDTPTAVVDGAIDTVSSDPQIDDLGTTEQSDLDVFVSDDIDVTFQTAGDEGEVKTQIVVDGSRFAVDTAENQLDGLIQLGCDEIDN